MYSATVIVASSSANAAIIASYVNGTSSGGAAGNNGTTSAIATANALTADTLSGIVTSTTSNGGGLATNNATLPGAPANNWLYASSQATDPIGTPSSTKNYYAFTITFNQNDTLGTLSFNSINGSSNNRNGGLNTAFTLFANVNGAGFTQVGTTQNSTPWTGSGGANPNTVSLGVQKAISFDLATIGSRVATDTVAFRLNLQDDSNTFAEKNTFIKDLQVTTVPEPSSALLLGAAALCVGLRRRR